MRKLLNFMKHCYFLQSTYLPKAKPINSSRTQTDVNGISRNIPVANYYIWIYHEFLVGTQPTLGH